MKRYGISLRAGRPSLAADVADLDVTPVMNMFIILIPFLVSMAAFSHLVAHDLGLAADEGAEHATEQQDAPLVVAVGSAGLTVVAGDLVAADLPRTGGKLDLSALTAQLRAIAPGQVVLAVDEEIMADEVVACLDACRAAGCDALKLAAGTGGTP